MSVPLGVPPLTRSEPEASLQKLPRLMLPSALRAKLEGAVSDWKSDAEITFVPPLLSLAPLFQNRFVVPVSVSNVASELPALSEALLVNTLCPPERKLKFDWVLLNDVLFTTWIGPGLLLSVIPWWRLSKAMQRRIVCVTAMPSPPSLKPFRSPFALMVPLESWP